MRKIFLGAYEQDGRSGMKIADHYKHGGIVGVVFLKVGVWDQYDHALGANATEYREKMCWEWPN